MSDPSDVLAHAVTVFCEQRFADVDTVADRAIGPLTASEPLRSGLAIERHCVDLLSRADPPLAGAGVVVTPYVLTDEPFWLEWWLAAADDAPGTARRLAVDLNPQSISFRDYTSLAWFEEPRRTGQRTITGPYVDYLCTDQYTLTFTTPLVHGDRFLGVAGVDVLARWFEEHLFRVVDDAEQLAEECVVVNGTGRVVACPGGTWVTGDLIRELGPGERSPADRLLTDWQLTDCPGTPFVVARRR